MKYLLAFMSLFTKLFLLTFRTDIGIDQINFKKKAITFIASACHFLLFVLLYVPPQLRFEDNHDVACLFSYLMVRFLNLDSGF